MNDKNGSKPVMQSIVAITMRQRRIGLECPELRDRKQAMAGRVPPTLKSKSRKFNLRSPSGLQYVYGIVVEKLDLTEYEDVKLFA